MTKCHIDTNNMETTENDRSSWRHVVHEGLHVFEQQQHRHKTEKRDRRKERENRGRDDQQYLAAARDWVCPAPESVYNI